MRIGRWPWVLFVILAVPLAVAGDPKGVVSVALPLAIIADVYVCVKRYGARVTSVYAASNALVVVAIVRSLISSAEPFVSRFDRTAVALLISSRTLAWLCTMFVITRSPHASVIRTYGYCTLMYTAQLLAIMHVRELATLLSTYTLAETTRAPCLLPNSSRITGFLFADSPFVSTCPTRVWEHIRINSLFASQLYVLYTLTTDLNYHHLTGTAAYVVGTLALIECTALGIAVGVQFDIIDSCYQLSWGVGLLLLSSAVAYTVRRLYTKRSKDAVAFSFDQANVRQHWHLATKLKL